MQKNKKFLLDENLGKLAKWLRILGYDSAVYKCISSKKKIYLCEKEHRIFLTRSKKIASRKEQFLRILIKSEKSDEQIMELLNIIKLDNELIFTRCTKCNYILKDIDVKSIENLIPRDIIDNFSEFKICRKCGSIYWHGSHYVAMKDKLNNLLTT
ncbi:MAG: Mut7-C RNAse domain-containing protein [Candidatus Tenebribacter davisii]|nr:Mut7-C RNAse domain-containing protein [Candidatus Tenebribacter davisii]